MRTAHLGLVGLLICGPVMAASKSDAEAAVTAAKAEEAQALSAQAAWTSTETALADAQKALLVEKWSEAKALADEALALAKRSREQAAEQKTLWQNAVIR